MEAKVRYPVGIQDFGELITGGYVYVDKTQYVTKLREAGKYYFLSRPRRFGKSLFLSTLAAFYRGQRELFRGLAADTDDWDWQPRPVLYVDLNNGTYTSAEGLQVQLDNLLRQWEREYGIERETDMPSVRFGNVIQRVFEITGRKVVILVDEYDKPLLSAMGDEPMAEIFRAQLKAFYSNLKTMDRCIELAFLTGVARFSKVSIFFDLNHLYDISFAEDYSAICGITSDELDSYFAEGIRSIADEYHMTPDEMRGLLQRWYDGYHFTGKCPDIYNPFSLINAFLSRRIASYWFDSGTPTFLVNMIRDGRIRMRSLSGCHFPLSELERSGLLGANPLPAFYQTGCLTIKEVDQKLDDLTLDYPNQEVKKAFMQSLVPMYVGEGDARTEFDVAQFVRDVQGGDTAEFMTRLESLVANVPYSSSGDAPEAHFQNLVYLLFTLMGFYTDMELRMASGRMDVTVRTDRYVYIIELKINSTPEAALAQARERGYALPYAASGRTVVLTGASFDPTERRLSGWLSETVEPGQTQR